MAKQTVVQSTEVLAQGAVIEYATNLSVPVYAEIPGVASIPRVGLRRRLLVTLLRSKLPTKPAMLRQSILF